MPVTAQNRKDIQNLRAWAVILVVLGHLAPDLVPGGFIGVDIFFVISGYVITGQMLRLHITNPKTFLRDFYVRRFRRILPSALFVILATLLMTRYFLGIVAENDFKEGAGWVTIFFGNFFFQSQSLDYFSTGQQSHPLQHYWSLAIEEQFYIFWPLLFLALKGKKITAGFEILVLSVIAISTLSLALYFSEISREPIFFNTLMRSWELIAGALALLVGKKFRISRALEFATLSILMISAILITPGMQWPRVTTLPVIAVTIYLLCRADQENIYLLNGRLMSFVGDVSFQIYLWHWPFLIIVKNINPDFGIVSIIQVVLLTAIATLVSHFCIERPFRNSNLILKHPILAIVVSLTTISLAASYFFLTTQR